jgi:hypothetical protein
MTGFSQDNDRLHLKCLKARKNIQRLRLERASVLLSRSSLPVMLTSTLAEYCVNVFHPSPRPTQILLPSLPPTVQALSRTRPLIRPRVRNTISNLHFRPTFRRDFMPINLISVQTSHTNPDLSSRNHRSRVLIHLNVSLMIPRSAMSNQASRCVDRHHVPFPSLDNAG